MNHAQEVIEVWGLLLNNPKAYTEQSPYGVHSLVINSPINVRVDLSCEPSFEIEPESGHISFRGATFEIDKEQVLKFRSQFHEKKQKASMDLKQVLNNAV